MPSVCSMPAKGESRVVAQFSDALEAHGACAGNSCAVCMDMSASYQAGVCEHLPWAAITFDKFHVIGGAEPRKARERKRRAEWTTPA